MDVPLFLESSLPPDLDHRVRSKLQEGERLLWVGQPRRRWFMREAASRVLLFGIPFTAFAVFWVSFVLWIEFSDQGKKDIPIAIQVVFPFCGLPFLVIGVGLLATPYWLRQKAKRTCYALTDRRAILFEAGVFGRKVTVRSYQPKALKVIERVDYPDGTGDLVFEEARQVWSDTDGHRRVSFEPRGFLGIDNAPEVEALLRRALLPGEASGAST